MRPRCLLVYDVLWVLSRYQYLAEAKIIKHRLSPLRPAPSKMTGSSKAYRKQPHSAIVQAMRRLAHPLRSAAYELSFALYLFGRRTILDCSGKLSVRLSVEGAVGRSVNGPDPRQANDRQPIVGSPWGSELVRYRVPRRLQNAVI